MLQYLTFPHLVQEANDLKGAFRELFFTLPLATVVGSRVLVG